MNPDILAAMSDDIIKTQALWKHIQEETASAGISPIARCAMFTYLLAEAVLDAQEAVGFKLEFALQELIRLVGEIGEKGGKA